MTTAMKTGYPHLDQILGPDRLVKGRSANVIEAGMAVLPRQAGRYETLCRELRARRRRIWAEWSVISKRLREGELAEERDKGAAPAYALNRQRDLARIHQLARYLHDIEDALSPYVAGRRSTFSPEFGVPSHPRFRLNVPVSVKSAEVPALRGWMLNLSSSGVGVALSRRITPGTSVGVQLHLRWGDLHLAGTVIWGDQTPLAGLFGYRHGIAFRHEQPGTFALDIFTVERPKSKK